MAMPTEFLSPCAPKYASVLLEYQNYIMDPPVSPGNLYAQACSSDQVTVDSWRETWLGNIKKNKAKFGSFKDHSAGKFFKQFKYQPAIIAGAGPSLKDNVDKLKHRGDLALVACLHSFHLMEDNDAHPDFYVSLDAGPVVIEEISEGGSKTPEEYWALTKNRKLIAYIGSPPELFEKWQGEVYLFNCAVPDTALMDEIKAIEPFNCWISNGGNVLGACLYFARGFLGCGTIAFVGADFCFSYDKKFHAWDSKYDKSLGYVIKAVDVHGNKRLTWQSYVNFKGWFEQLPYQTPQLFINCSEGGCLGSYPEGNIIKIEQMPLQRFIFMHRMHEELEDQMLTPETAKPKLLF